MSGSHFLEKTPYRLQTSIVMGKPYSVENFINQIVQLRALGIMDEEEAKEHMDWVMSLKDNAQIFWSREKDNSVTPSSDDYWDLSPNTDTESIH